jgi:hypothetical protein
LVSLANVLTYIIAFWYTALKWFPAGDAQNPIDYTGGRDLDSLVDL